ncbi:MAG TPA: GTP cyclohydrolase II, partial [Massilia timonae]|nr:GTP cyclohydrolase II [Massilia timonae]
MTNNPRKIDALNRIGVTVAERVPLLVNRNAYNNSYLNTKQAKLGHMMAPLTAVEQGEKALVEPANTPESTPTLP